MTLRKLVKRAASRLLGRDQEAAAGVLSAELYVDFGDSGQVLLDHVNALFHEDRLVLKNKTLPTVDIRQQPTQHFGSSSSIKKETQEEETPTASPAAELNGADECTASVAVAVKLEQDSSTEPINQVESQQHFNKEEHVSVEIDLTVEEGFLNEVLSSGTAHTGICEAVAMKEEIPEKQVVKSPITNSKEDHKVPVVNVKQGTKPDSRARKNAKQFRNGVLIEQEESIPDQRNASTSVPEIEADLDREEGSVSSSKSASNLRLHPLRITTPAKDQTNIRALELVPVLRKVIWQPS
jgi:hypothetical protein